jgi:heterodisulfide reductase subunit C
MIDIEFINQVNELSEQSIQLCYHCHKCTAGCPASADMDYGPDRILHMIQLGQRKQLLSSHDIWLCASCETCGTRCPNEIDIARVMDSLRQISIHEGAILGEPDAIKFHRLFLFVVQTLGRSHEASLLIALKLWTLNLMADMDSGIVMVAKGKVPLIPHPIKARQEVKRIFEKTMDLPQP